MRYLDTNILVRLITGDDDLLRRKALDLVESAKRNELYVDDSALVELCFVLEFHEYKMKRQDISQAILDLFGQSQITYGDYSEAAVSMFAKKPKLDYTDCLLIVKSGGNVASFDTELNKSL